jgi:ribosomal 50S subunit-associated protein YjgA (DUF615 family)
MLNFFSGPVPIAEVGPEILILIPVMALAIPIINMLIKHQQRMAEIIHGTAHEHSNSEISQLRREVYELKQMVHQQMIALDSQNSVSRIPVEQPLQRRLEEA